MEQAIRIFALIHLVVMGLSHILAPRAWAEFFIWMRGKGHAGVFAVGGMSLWFGSVIAAFHNVWSGMPMVLTLIGWAQVVKGGLYFLFPEHGMRGLRRVSIEGARMFIYAGVGLLVLAGLVAYPMLAG